MLLANREVAELLNHALEKAKIKPVLYRIHDAPDSEKIAELALFVKALGHHLPLGGRGITGKDLQQLFKKIEGEAEEALIKTTALRSMSKAIYSTKNIGHFGLAFAHYTHFTSPIRRYADLLIHRLLALHLHHEPMREREWVAYEQLAEHITEREIGAAEAERESVKMKQVEYMAERVGQTFEGTISGVTEWGIYIEDTETKAEGMAALRNFGDDFYSLDEKNYCIKGQRTGKKYTLGDKVRFKVIDADTERKTLDVQILTGVLK
jgi:ribonuclease R